MLQDGIISEQMDRINMTQACVGQWVPAFKASERFSRAHEVAVRACDAAGKNGGMAVQVARDAYRQAAEELEFSLQSFILSELSKLRPILDTLEINPDWQNQCQAMRQKLRNLERDIRSRDASILGIILHYGELLRLLGDVFNAAEKKTGARVAIYA